MRIEIVAMNHKGQLCILTPLIPEEKDEYVCHQDEEIGWRISTMLNEPQRPIIYLCQIKDNDWGLMRVQAVEKMTLLGAL